MPATLCDLSERQRAALLALRKRNKGDVFLDKDGHGTVKATIGSRVFKIPATTTVRSAA